MCKRCTYLPVVLASLLLASSAALSDRRSITIVGASRTPEVARAIDSGGVLYVAVNDFISALRLPFGESVETHKIEFRLPAYRLKVTAGSPFLVITELANNSASVYQLPISSLYESGVYYVPLQEFIRVLSYIWSSGVVFDTREMAMRITEPPPGPVFDITDLDVQPKLNGYLLTLKASRQLGDVEAWLKPDGWLFVTVTDARAHTVA